MSLSSAENNYRYDVFVSYTRNPIVGEWVQNHFLSLFRHHLDNALGYHPEIFVDTQSISAGDTWPLQIREALSYSKCLIAVVSPPYFRSNWCMEECHTMLAREKLEGFGREGNGKGLVIPVIAGDGKHHPRYISNIQSADFRRFVMKGGAFVDSPRYLEFQDMMARWTEQVADVVQQAPDWKPHWLNDLVVEVPEPEPINIDKPRLR